MKTNRIMDEIRSTISPEMKLQMEMSVAIANRIYETLATICKVSSALGEDVVTVTAPQHEYDSVQMIH